MIGPPQVHQDVSLGGTPEKPVPIATLKGTDTWVRLGCKPVHGGGSVGRRGHVGVDWAWFAQMWLLNP
jgi:hypothetical protein